MTLTDAELERTWEHSLQIPVNKYPVEPGAVHISSYMGKYLSKLQYYVNRTLLLVRAYGVHHTLYTRGEKGFTFETCVARNEL